MEVLSEPLEATRKASCHTNIVVQLSRQKSKLFIMN